MRLATWKWLGEKIMHVVADSNQPFAGEAFSRFGQVTLLPAKQITRAALADADLLICRSTVKVNADLLAGTPIKFVGTCTIGVDHVDETDLKARGIGFAAAPGCNANSVGEYVVALLLRWALAQGAALSGKTIGIVGVGNVGRRLEEKARALGLRVLRCDPPRAEAGEPGFSPLEDLLAQSDFLTLHVPLEKTGAHPTFELADARFFAQMKRGAFFINASRGKVMREDALLSALESGQLGGAALDVYYNEPNIPPALHARLFSATPHIAGHSFDGKVAGTEMILAAAARFFGLSGADAEWSALPLMPAAPIPLIERAATGSMEADLDALVRPCYDILADDARLRAAPSTFYDLRQHYPLRLEFRHTTIRTNSSALRSVAAALGFQVATK